MSKGRWPRSSTDYVHARKRDLLGLLAPRPHVTMDCRKGDHELCPEGREITDLCFCECHRPAVKATKDGS